MSLPQYVFFYEQSFILRTGKLLRHPVDVNWMSTSPELLCKNVYVASNGPSSMCKPVNRF